MQGVSWYCNCYSGNKEDIHNMQVKIASFKTMTVPVLDSHRVLSAQSLEQDLQSGREVSLSVHSPTTKFVCDTVNI